MNPMLLKVAIFLALLAVVAAGFAFAIRHQYNDRIKTDQAQLPYLNTLEMISVVAFTILIVLAIVFLLLAQLV